MRLCDREMSNRGSVVGSTGLTFPLGIASLQTLCTIREQPSRSQKMYLKHRKMRQQVVVLRSVMRLARMCLERYKYIENEERVWHARPGHDR